MRAPFLKAAHCKPIGCLVFIGLSFAIIAGLTGFILETANIAAAQTKNKETQNEEIHIKADKVIADLDKRETELLGNVRVTQQKTTISADRMRVYYQDANSPKSDTTIQGAITKIIANGNVTITMENMTALTEEAIYIRDTEVFTLSGIDSKLSSGPHSITGSKIIFFRVEGKLIVESSAQNRVRAVIYPGKKEFF